LILHKVNISAAQYNKVGSSPKRHSLEVIARNRKVCGLFFSVDNSLTPGLDWPRAARPVTIPVMPKFSRFYSRLYSLLRPVLLAVAGAAMLGLPACSPSYNWREVRGAEAPFVVLLPGKPSTHSREVNLDGIRVTMTMTATEVGGATFAVGGAQLPEPALVQPALNAMKTALVRNINGTVTHEKAAAATHGALPATTIEAAGSAGGDKVILLFARFAAHDRRIYQAIVVGPEKAISRDAVETFLTSFKPG
jgi:hypothetical protein